LEKKRDEDQKKLREKLQMTNNEDEKKRIESELANLDTVIYSQ